MPIVELHVLEGYQADEKRRMAKSITDAVRFVVPAAPELADMVLGYPARLARRS